MHVSLYSEYHCRHVSVMFRVFFSDWPTTFCFFKNRFAVRQIARSLTSDITNLRLVNAMLNFRLDSKPVQASISIYIAIEIIATSNVFFFT